MARRLKVAIEVARAAGERTLHYFNTTRFRVDVKGDGSPVTTADRESEEELRRGIARAFPDDGILGEEFPEKRGGSGYRWVIDPIDGTKSFVHGVPLYGVLVAVEREMRTVAGVILMPALGGEGGEMVYGSRGAGAWQVVGKEGARPARVSAVGTLREALVCVTGFEYFAKCGREDLLMELGRRARVVRGWSDCYGHVLVATGRADAIIEPAMKPWDGAASTVILEEAGGAYTDWAGAATAHSGDGVASNGLVHAELLAMIGSPRGAES